VFSFQANSGRDYKARAMIPQGAEKGCNSLKSGKDRESALAKKEGGFRRSRPAELEA
jgi:hypothetical protein